MESGRFEMETELQPFLQLGCSIDDEDAKYVSRLSTIMVATIQEVKDRIAQIEYIFCGQLYPKSQSRPKRLQMEFAEAMKAAEDGWKNKERQFLTRIEELQLENKKALEEKQNVEAMKNAEDAWRKKESELLVQIQELQFEKNKALEENHKLAVSLEEKAKSLSTAESQWKWKENFLLFEVNELRDQEKKALEENQCLATSLKKNETILQQKEQLLNEREAEKKLLQDKLENIQRTAEDEWKRKEALLKFEMEERCNKKQKSLEENQTLVASLKKEKTMSLHYEQLLNRCENEKKQLLEKLESSEKNEDVVELQNQLKQKAEEVATGKQLQKNLLQQIEIKDNEMSTEKKKRRDLVDSFKRLKSQYNFLCNKFGLNTENSPPNNRMEEENNLPRIQRNPKSTPGLTDENHQNSGPASKKIEQISGSHLQEKLDDDIKSRSVENSSFHSNIKTPSTSSARPLKVHPSARSGPLSGTKRSAPYWRGTRSREEAGGADPHDDFLDTPMENIKGNLNKALKQDVQDVPVPATKDMSFDSSDDETQDLNPEPNVEPAPQKQQISITKPADKGFKYVEPVRKKADRDNLKGFECKQCKKFYDAVLPENGKNGENTNSNFRCEHHDGVSRHRYKYVPPMTPEGFWNIGFESEM